MTKSMRLESRSNPHKMQSLGDKSGSTTRVQQHRGEECPWRGRPDLGGMCDEKWLKSGPTYQRDLLFRMVYPTASTLKIFSSLKQITAVDSLPSSQHFLGELATITDVTVLQMGPSLDCRDTLTNTAAWPPTVFGDGTRRLARGHVALQSLQVQRRPRAATTHSLIDQQKIQQGAYTDERKKIHTVSRLIQMCVELT